MSDLEKLFGVNKDDLIQIRTSRRKRACKGKIDIGKNYRKKADKMTRKHGQIFGVYHCPFCNGWHLTTRIHLKYSTPLVYVTKP